LTDTDFDWFSLDTGLFQKLTGRFVFKDNGFGFFFWYWIFFQSTSATKVKLLGEPDNGRTALFSVYGYYQVQE
jgi:hypothetical protein